MKQHWVKEKTKVTHIWSEFIHAASSDTQLMARRELVAVLGSEVLNFYPEVLTARFQGADQAHFLQFTSIAASEISYKSRVLATETQPPST